MRIKQLKVGQRVADISQLKDHATVKEVSKKEAKLEFKDSSIIVYDKHHVQFLRTISA